MREEPDHLRAEDLGDALAQHPGTRAYCAYQERVENTVIGVADLVGTVPNLSHSDLRAHTARHQVPESDIGEDFKYSTAWVLERAKVLREPVAYRHPAGAVIWVNLDPEVTALIEWQLADG